jgi:thiamine-phosphate pyrophosphorylase
MEMNKVNLQGLYLVVDPSAERLPLLSKVEVALRGGVDILQIWNRWRGAANRAVKETFISQIGQLAADFDVPVFINDDWELLKTTSLQGIHFDTIPDDFNRIKREVNRPFLAGITCSNNLKLVQWADRNDLDYISFCAMYPSPSAGSCEIVRPGSVQKARQLTGLPLFVSGGITPLRIREMDDIDFDGIAVISGILDAKDAYNAAKNYKKALGNHD